MEYQHVHQELAERTFKCAHCGARGEVVLHAIGKSGWQREEDFFSGDPSKNLEQVAEEELRADALAVVDLIKCKTCGQRAPRAVFWLVFRAVFCLAIAAAAMALEINWLWFIWVPFGAVGGFLAIRGVSRLRRARRAVFTKFTPGKLAAPAPRPVQRPAPAPVPKPVLPEARAIAAPPVVPPKPRAPGDEPSLLR